MARYRRSHYTLHCLGNLNILYLLETLVLTLSTLDITSHSSSYLWIAQHILSLLLLTDLDPGHGAVVVPLLVVDVHDHVVVVGVVLPVLLLLPQLPRSLRLSQSPSEDGRCH